MRCPRGRGGDVELDQRPGARSGKLLAPWRARARRRQLSACLAGTKQLAGLGQHSAGPPGGPAGGSGPVSFFSDFISFFYFFCNFVGLFKILRLIQNSPNFCWTLFRIFPNRNILVWEYLSI